MKVWTNMPQWKWQHMLVFMLKHHHLGKATWGIIKLAAKKFNFYTLAVLRQWCCWKLAHDKCPRRQWSVKLPKDSYKGCIHFDTEEALYAIKALPVESQSSMRAIAQALGVSM